MKTKETFQILTSHPTMDQLALLLREELKSRKLSELLHQLGVEECPWLPSLNEPIAECLGLSTDEEFLAYDKMVDECVKELSNQSNITEAARQLAQRLQV